MVVTIKRDSGLFPTAVADELNKSFNTINKNIEAYKNVDLDYKEDVQLIPNTTNTFRSGNVLCIREKFTIDHRLEKFTELISYISVSVPYDIWTYAISDKQEFIQIHIKGNTVYGYGTLSSYPQTVNLAIDAVLPKI